MSGMGNKTMTGKKSESGIGSSVIDRYTTVQIDALTGMVAGDTVFDTDLKCFKNYSGSVWELDGTPQSLAIAYAVGL